jgi:hypothetical protein
MGEMEGFGKNGRNAKGFDGKIGKKSIAKSGELDPFSKS